MNRYAGETMLLLGELLNEVDLSGHFHTVDIRRKRNYAARIGIQCGMTTEDCGNLYLEGMTYNQTSIYNKGLGNETVSPSPHCDINNGVDNGNNFLICLSWMQQISTNEIVRHVLLGYMRRVISAAIKRGILADSVETVVTQYVDDLPKERQHVCPSYILKEMNDRCDQDALFVLPCNMEKEAFYSLIVTDVCEYADIFKLGFFRRIELLCVVFTANGPDRIHSVLASWKKSHFCPKELFPCAFMNACCHWFKSTASEGRYGRYQFFTSFGTTIDDWILSLVTLGHTCELANEGGIKYDAAVRKIKSSVMGAGPMGINHFLGCAVLMGVLHDTSFSKNAALSSSCLTKIACTAFQGTKSLPSTSLCAFRSSMRKLAMNDSYGDQVFCEATRKTSAMDVFHPTQSIYRIDYDKDEVVRVMSVGFEERIGRNDSKDQIMNWRATTENDSYFPWWKLPSNATRSNIRDWSKKVSHERSLIHSELVYFGHSKSNGNLDIEREKCHIRFNKKMETQNKLRAVKHKTKATKIDEPVSKKRKQSKQRKLLKDSIRLRGNKENGGYLDTFSFGWESDDGTVCSLGDLSSMTPAGWYSDESIHRKIHHDWSTDNSINITKDKTPISGRIRNSRNTGKSFLDIFELSKMAWKERFGQNLDISFKTFPLYGRTMHMAYCNGIYHQIFDNNTSKWMFPQYVEDKHYGTMCFPRIKMAKRAFLWHVLVHVSTLKWRQQWLGSMIKMDGIDGSTVLIERRGSHSMLELVLNGSTFVFKELGGNGKWVCCLQ
jgi:hypothetical protein